jgi:hypothetical protein
MADPDRVEIVLVGWRRGEEFEAAIAYQRALPGSRPDPAPAATGRTGARATRAVGTPSAAGHRS